MPAPDPQTRDAPILRVAGRVKSFAGHRVVDGVDLQCRAGQVLGLLGANGASKTTTLTTFFQAPFATYIHHINIPFLLVILLLGFASSTYFPLEGDSPWTQAWLTLNPLHHLAEGIRLLLLAGEWNSYLLAACGLFVLMILLLVPIDERRLRWRVLGEG